MLQRLTSWIKRFLPAELIGSTLAVSASFLTLRFTGNKILAAYAGAIGDTSGFYLTIITQSLLIKHRTVKQTHQKFSLIHLLAVLKDTIIEFGPAELLDSFMLRPFFMYLFPTLLKNYALGIIIGKITSDVAFYIPVMAGNEIRMRLSKGSK